MSDLSMYESGDIAWDELCMSDDHTVPLPGVEQTNEHSLWDNNYQRHCLGVVGGQDIARDASLSKNAGETIETEKPPFVNNKRKRMLETEPVPQASDCVFNSCNKDSGKEASLVHDANPRFGNCFEINSIDPLGGEFRAADAIPTDKTAAVDSNSYSYPLSQPESDITFFDETHDIKNSGDLLYYGWSDISNLEEVAQIFSNKDEFGWFASPEAIEASLDGSKPEFKFTDTDFSPVESNSNSCEHLRNETHSSEGKSFHDFQHRIPSAEHSTNDNSKTMDMRKLQPRHGAQSWGETKDPLGVCSNSLHDEVLEEASKGASSDVLSCKGIKKEKQPMVQDSLSYLPCHTHYLHSDYSSSSDLTSEYGTPSAGKFDNNGIKPYFPKESYTSSQKVLQSSFSSKLENMDMLIQDPLCNPVPVQTKVQHPANKFDIIGDAEEVPTELGPSTLRERSSVSSTLDDTSLEAASLCQLQLVMEQLDPRTKLCIRDSLYRLARSAAQRHNDADLDVDSSPNDQDNSRVMLGEGTNKYTRFMEIETDTNPLDRSIAHLLFHRPSAAQTATTPTQERSLHDSATTIHGCILKPQGVSGKLVNNIKTEGEVADP